jgi:hypothetical protein
MQVVLADETGSSRQVTSRSRELLFFGGPVHPNETIEFGVSIDM